MSQHSSRLFNFTVGVMAAVALVIVTSLAQHSDEQDAQKLRQMVAERK